MSVRGALGEDELAVLVGYSLARIIILKMFESVTDGQAGSLKCAVGL